MTTIATSFVALILVCFYIKLSVALLICSLLRNLRFELDTDSKSSRRGSVVGKSSNFSPTTNSTSPIRKACIDSVLICFVDFDFVAQLADDTQVGLSMFFIIGAHD